MKQERQMHQDEIEKAFDKMLKTFYKKGVDSDTRGFVLRPRQVLYIKSMGDYSYNDSFIEFTKDEPVKHRDFKLEDYPPEVQEILKQQYNADDLDDDYFPNFIATAEGDDLLDAIEKMTKMSVLLDHGWSLFTDEQDYEYKHRKFFGSGNIDEVENEDDESKE